MSRRTRSSTGDHRPMAQAVQPRTGSPAPTKPAPSPPKAKRKVPFLVELYRSALGKKYVMAITGIVFMLYVLLHMVGNLKMFYGPEELNQYAEFLRNILFPILPHSGFLWLLRTAADRRPGPARPRRLRAHGDEPAGPARPSTRRPATTWPPTSPAARCAGAGVIVLLFIVWHLADLTWGWANPDFVYGDVYHNVDASLEQVPVAIFYIVANLALGVHLYHGAWSIFQSLGFEQPPLQPVAAVLRRRLRRRGRDRQRVVPGRRTARRGVGMTCGCRHEASGQVNVPVSGRS